MRAPPKPVLIGGGLLLAAVAVYFLLLRNRGASAAGAGAVPATVGVPSSGSGAGSLLGGLPAPFYGSAGALPAQEQAEQAAGSQNASDPAPAVAASDPVGAALADTTSPTVTGTGAGVVVSSPSVIGFFTTPYGVQNSGLPADTQAQILAQLGAETISSGPAPDQIQLAMVHQPPAPPPLTISAPPPPAKKQTSESITAGAIARQGGVGGKALK